MAANKIQCPYGHFFNADKYERCPVCNKDIQPVPHIADSGTSKKVTTASRSQFEETPVIASDPVRHSDASGKTASMFGGNSPVNADSRPQMNRTFSVQDLPQTPAQQPEQAVHTAPLPEPEPVPPATSSLQAAVDAVVSHKDANDVKTVAVWNAPAGTEPIVGWLICVKGEYFGQSFNLKTGNNTVGRAMNMDIPLAQEPSVSRNKHCVITFEPENQVFFLQQGESSGLTYLNGAMVMSPTGIKEQDRIKIGAAEFLLIPFCADGFRWEDYI